MSKKSRGGKKPFLLFISDSKTHTDGTNQLKKIKKKKVRNFYEEQNERLNDWVEVDALVTAIGEDIIDSMNPDVGECIESACSIKEYMANDS